MPGGRPKGSPNKINKNDLSGKKQKNGRLTAICQDGSNRHGNIFWKCLCDCGSNTRVTAAKFKNEHTKSCGCLDIELISKRRVKDISGQKFGRLSAIKRIGSDNHGNCLWQCACDCGNDNYLTITRDLLSKKTRSCGCIKNVTQMEIFNNVVKPLCPDAVSEFKIPNSRQKIDIFIESISIAIEVDGYQHSQVTWYDKGDLSKLVGRQIRDQKKELHINSNGWSLLRVPTLEYSKNPQKWKEIIENFIKEAQNG